MNELDIPFARPAEPTCVTGQQAMEQEAAIVTLRTALAELRDNYAASERAWQIADDALRLTEDSRLPDLLMAYINLCANNQRELGRLAT